MVAPVSHKVLAFIYFLKMSSFGLFFFGISRDGDGIRRLKGRSRDSGFADWRSGEYFELLGFVFQHVDIS